MVRRALVGGLAALLMMTGSTLAQSSIQAGEWSAYKAKFLDPSGRIVDDANGRISHSEGQGYGLLLAYLAGNRGDFDRIWSFTRTELMLRDDGLAVWKWSPDSTPHVNDANDASDGDLLIAYGLGLAGVSWDRPDLTQNAMAIATALTRHVVVKHQGRSILMPGVDGFSAKERDDGPVVNPSYWVFEALSFFAGLQPDGPWDALRGTGESLIKASRTGPRMLPPDWVSIAASPKPAKGFPPEFSYNAVRIPLYLLRDGIEDRALLESLRTGMMADDGSVRLVDLPSGDTVATLTDPGYRIIPAMISCALEKTALPDDLKTFQPTAYYPSTLQLLALSYARRTHPECL